VCASLTRTVNKGASMYRNISYNPKTQKMHLWTWDESGNRIEQIEDYHPYIYIESNTQKDAVSIYNTPLRKITFPSQFDRRRYVESCGTQRIFYNLKAEHQYLIDKFNGLNASAEFTKHPLKTFFLDIETYSVEFPEPEKAAHPINLITVYDSLSKIYHTFGLAHRHLSLASDHKYYEFQTEAEMLRAFVKFWREDYPDIVSGWYCLTKNQYLWGTNKIVNLSKKCENIPLFTSEKFQNNINNYIDTGIKEEYNLTTELGHSILCSKEHIFPICSKNKNAYKNSNTLLSTLTDTKVKDINTQNKDSYVFIPIRDNNNKQLNYRNYIIDNWTSLKNYTRFNFKIKSVQIRDHLKQYKNSINIPTEYWQGKIFWKRKGWDYKNLQKYISDDMILEYLKNETVLTILLTQKFININLDEVISSDILRFLGYTFTDGCVDFKTFTNQYSSQHQYLVEKYSSIYNNIDTNCPSNIKVLSRLQQSDNNFYKRVSCNNKFGVLLPLIYNTENKKQLNISMISMLSYDQFIEFYSGLIDGDGNVADTQLNVCNYDKCYDIPNINILQQLLLWNGVISSVTKHNTGIPFINENKKFISDLNIWHQDRKNKLKNIKYYIKKNIISNKIKWFKIENGMLVKIKNIQKTGKNVEMCDIETQTHYFICNGIKTHNCERFDIPYIINRIENVIGEDWVYKLSPVGQVRYRENVEKQFGKEIGRWYIGGISCIDYWKAYKTFSRGDRESYSLDYISELELGEGKVNVSATSLTKLADTNWDKFVEYNVRDVELLVKLEQKLRFLQLMRTISYKGLAALESALGKVTVVTGAIAQQALKHNKIIPTFKHEEMGSYAGGFVRDITPGLYESIVVFDANSLYPNTIISLNISPETKIGKILSMSDTEVELKLVNGKMHTLTKDNFKTFIEKEKISISKAKVLYTQKTLGIVPEFVQSLYDERVKSVEEIDKINHSQSHTKKGSDKYNENIAALGRLDIIQNTLKTILNSLYGCFANRYAPLADIDHSGSITLTGQATIKAANDILDNFAKTEYGIDSNITFYNDTDSTVLTLEPILKKLKIPLLDETGEVSRQSFNIVKKLNNVLNTQIIEWAKNAINSLNPQFVFKREYICSAGIYEAKKYYILHIKDKSKGDTPLPTDKIKYVGVEVAKSTISKECKNLIKKVVETIIYTKSREQTIEVYKQIFEEFKKLSYEDIASRSNINGFDKYNNRMNGLVHAKGTPVHVKGAINHNNLIKALKLENVYDFIGSGNKIKWIYVMPNKYGFENIAFADKFPKEFESVIKPDYDKMFEKHIVRAIESRFISIGWRLIDFKNEYTCDLFEFFKV